MSNNRRKSAPAEEKDATTIDVGDHVFIGSGAVHWIVTRLTTAARENPDKPFVRLESGMSQITRPACLSELRLHSKGESDG